MLFRSLKVLRGILLKGVVFGDVWRPTLSMMAIAAVLLAISVRRFRKTIE